MTNAMMAIILVVFSLFIFLGEKGDGEEEVAFAQTTVPPPYTITNIRIDGDLSRADINFGTAFGAAIPLDEILAGTTRAGTGITISSVTFAPVPFNPGFMAFLDCDGKIYITTTSRNPFATDFPISVIINDPGTSSLTSGDTLPLIINVDTTLATTDGTEPLCELATPENPIAVSSITDNAGGFTELTEAWDITTVKIDSSTYALVASSSDNGVQIINITDPENPTATSSINDGDDDGTGTSSTFDELEGSRGITTVKIGESTYALVAAFFDNGVQIINITDPENPTATSSINDGDDDGTGTSSIFDELRGAYGITTVKIGESTYALVTAERDDGVQIINITDPENPTAASSVTDDDDGFDTFHESRGITTVQIGESTYALVASFLDHGVQIINITDPENPTAVSSINDGDTDGGGNSFDVLERSSGIATVQIGQSTYALVAALLDDGVQIINITDPTAPIVTSSITDGDTSDTAAGVFDVTTIQIGESTYALVTASSSTGGVQIIDISNPTAPTVASAITDGNTFDRLDGARGITTVQIDSSVYALVASANDGVQIIRIADNQPEPEPEPEISEELVIFTNPIAVSSVTDGMGGFDELDGAASIITVTIDSFTYALVASEFDDGVQIIDITNPATPIAVSSITDATATNGSPFDALNGAFSITSIQIGSSLYALVASFNDDGMQIIDISDPTTPTAVSSVTDGDLDSNGVRFRELDGSVAVTAVKIGESTYALVTANRDRGIQIINITNPIAPTVASSIANGVDGFNISLIRHISTVQIGASTYALVTSFSSGGYVQIIDISDPTAPIFVSLIDENIANGSDVFSSTHATTTITIGSSTYALVASQSEDGVQIIDISDPAMPTFVSSVTDATADNSSPFDELDGASDITTVTIGESLYAIVASTFDDGVQIIDITDLTTPTAVASITDGVGGFDELDAATGITTVKIDSSTYVLVASASDDGVQIIRISGPEPPVTPENPLAVTSITDGVDGFDELDAATGITTAKVDSSTYALVTSKRDDGVQIIDITDPATPTAVTSFDDDGSTVLDGATGITTVKIDGSTYALVASDVDDGIQIINMTKPNPPTVVSSIIDGVGGFDQLEGAFGVTTAKIASSTYALVASVVDNGVQIIDITDPAAPTAVSSITDTTTSNGSIFNTLDGAISITTAKIASSTYALVASVRDSGVQIINISNPTAPRLVSSITDGDPDGDGGTFDTLGGAFDITTVKIGQATYALVASRGDNGIQIIDVSNPSKPTDVSSISDGDSDGARGTFNTLAVARSITTLTIGDSTYALVVAQGDNGVQIINITNPAVPTVASSIIDDINGFTALAASTDITTVQIDSSIYALVTSNSESAVQIILIAEDQPEPKPVCELDLGTISLDFGTVDAGTTSSEGSIAIQNSGNMDNDVKIGADFWCTAADNGCTGSNGVIFPNRTSFGITQGSSYAVKQAFNDFIYDDTGASPSRDTHQTLPFEALTLFTLDPDETDTVYLQTQVELILRDGESQNRFQGDVSQEIILESNCN